MKYEVKFNYLDGKNMFVVVDDEYVAELFERLSSGMIYWMNSDMKKGFWLDLNKIRCIEFEEKTEDEL